MGDTGSAVGTVKVLIWVLIGQAERNTDGRSTSSARFGDLSIVRVIFFILRCNYIPLPAFLLQDFRDHTR